MSATPAAADEQARVMEMSRVRQSGDFWVVEVLSPVPDIGWIVQSERATEAEAQEDRKNWL